ncbi:hypothetical protein PCANC_03718 [Puccinia coronata f. sp. avenae]|uniref:Uncharacterized protein n=1 Tax=Puccinia coronata f. sp. avenae TaxID=200324 RepID=A0A2N5VXS3_9BASI|nr:hypothetical protein PCANC_03718 [Puccinia coronata f. sp. avenae]
MLQELWRGTREKLTQMLRSLAEILNGTYVSQERRNQEDQTDDTQAEPEEEKAHQARAMQLTLSAIPVLKLAQLFYTKLLKTATSTPLLFTLDPEMSTHEHNALWMKTECFQ